MDKKPDAVDSTNLWGDDIFSDDVLLNAAMNSIETTLLGMT